MNSAAKNPVVKILIITVAGLAFLGSWMMHRAEVPSNYVLPAVPAVTEEASYEALWVSRQQTAETHSASMTLYQDQPVAVWYGGTEEGHEDVALFFASLDPATNQWSEPKPIMDRATAEQGLGRFIRKVGNPAIHTWPDGTITVYFVTVSIGGWGGSAIAQTDSSDGGLTWSTPTRLITSPFINISTLVRTNAVPLADGRIQLPVYHEFLGKFAEALTLDQAGHIYAKTRMTRGKHSLQPAIAPLTETSAIALLRYSGDKRHRVLMSKSYDSGIHWTPSERLDIPNPDSAVAVLNVGNGQLLAAVNDLEEGRIRLSLAVASVENAKDWNVFHVVDEEPDADPESHEFEFSYPSMMVDTKGTVHLVYTWNQKRIRHVQFNQNWLANHAG